MIKSFNSKPAFTLAEVLITLGIIGIVSAMTLPTLITNYQKKQTVTQLKKVYTEMSQAVKMSELENGETEYWDFNLDARDFYNRYLKNQMSAVQDMSYATYKNSVTYKNLNGGACVDSWCANSSYYIMLSNGSVLGIPGYNSSNYKTFVVDVNGQKGPNVIGKDYFLFTIQNSKLGVVPYGFANAYSGGGSFGTTYDRNKIKAPSMQYSCSRATRGIWCAALIMTDGWEIRDDYPW